MKTTKASVAAAFSVLTGEGSRENMHFNSDLTQEQVGPGSPATVTIGSDCYAATVLVVRRNKDGKISYVKVNRSGQELEFRLRKQGSLRSGGHGSYGLVLGFAETQLDRSF